MGCAQSVKNDINQEKKPSRSLKYSQLLEKIKKDDYNTQENRELDHFKYFVKSIYPLPIDSIDDLDINDLLNCEKNFIESEEAKYNQKIYFNNKKIIDSLAFETNIKFINFKYFSFCFVNYFQNDAISNYYNNVFSNINIKIISDNNINNSLNEIKNLCSTEEWIIVIPCLISFKFLYSIIKQSQFKYIFIYCHDQHIHNEKYFSLLSNNIFIIKTNDELIENLLEINRKYTVPSLNFDFNCINKDKVIKFAKFEKIKIQNSKVTSQLLIKSYFFYKDILEGKNNLSEKDGNYHFSFISEFITNAYFLTMDEKYQLVKEFLPKLLLVAYNFINYDYVFSDLEDRDIFEILKIYNGKTINEEKYIQLFYPIIESINKMYDSILNKDDNEKDKILLTNTIHKHLIIFILAFNKKFDFYNCVNFLRDIDFCFKFFLISIKKNPISESVKKSILDYTDKRFSIITKYKFSYEFNKDQNILEYNCELNKEQIEILNIKLKFKNLLVIGNSKLHNIIKNLNLPYEKTFLDINELNDFFNEPKFDKNNYKIMKYYVVMNIMTADKYFNELKLLIEKYGLSIMFILLCPNNVFYSKNLCNGDELNVIVVHTVQDIQNVFDDFSKKLSCTEIFNLFKKTNNNKNSNSKNLFLNKYYNNENKWDFIKNINLDLFQNEIKNELEKSDSNLDKYKSIIYEIFKSNNLLDIYINSCCNYFGIKFYPEENDNSIILCKKFLYGIFIKMKNSNNQNCYFKDLINNELKKGNIENIKKIFTIIDALDNNIKTSKIKKYKGCVYKSFNFNNEFLNVIKKEMNLYCPCFNVFYKEEDLAKKFMENKNVLICIDVDDSSNVDLEAEHIFEEFEGKEVLLLPFTFYIVKDIDSITNDNNEKYYKIRLEYFNDKKKKSNENKKKLRLVDEGKEVNSMGQ